MFLSTRLPNTSFVYQFDLDSVWTFIFQVPANQAVAVPQKGAKTELIGEAAIVILAMVRTMLNQVTLVNNSVCYLIFTIYH